ncbi:MAG: hypothetical protein IJL38_00590 [Bacteroidales bacterium]|nr:hypothetical protein [Bacteroidales bacterium]
MKRLFIAFFLVLLTITASNATTLNGDSPRYGIDKGYRGFAYTGYTVGFGTNPYGRITLGTIHGRQFSDIFFLGGGIAFNYFPPTNVTPWLYSIPAFVAVRWDIRSSTRYKAFFQIRDGITLELSPAAYLDLGAGLRIEVGSQTAINLSAGYEILLYTAVTNTQTAWYPFSGASLHLALEFMPRKHQ